MNIHKQLLIVFFTLLIISCSNTNEDDLIQRGGAPLLSGLGTHDHKISTEIPGAQRYFNQGLVLSFAFNHAESIRSFKAVSYTHLTLPTKRIV